MASPYRRCMYALGLTKGSQQVWLLGATYVGKSTILYQLAGKKEKSFPTTGIEIVEAQIHNVWLQFWEMGFGYHPASLWEINCRFSQGIVFVIDSTNRQEETLALAKKHLHKLLAVPELANTKVLIFANKRDKDNGDSIRSMSAEEIVEHLSLRELPQRHWWVHIGSALTRDGIIPGMAWLANAITRTELPEHEMNTDITLNQ